MRQFIKLQLIRGLCATALLPCAAVRLSAAALSPAALQSPDPVDPQAFNLKQSSLPDAVLGLRFHASVQAAGGSGQCAMRLDGDLPPCLTTEAGADTLSISGIPTSAGDYRFDVTATDLDGRTAAHSYTLHVLYNPLLGHPTAVTINLNEALTEADTDLLFYPLKINITEALHEFDTDHLAFALVESIPEALHETDVDTVTLGVGVLPLSVPAATYNLGYLVEFTPVGNVGGVSLLPSGTLPTGMYFGIVSGKLALRGSPQVTGTYNFTITAKDSVNTDVIPYTLVINPASQSISFGSAPSPIYGGPPFAITATSTSGLPVTISVLSGPVSGSGPYTPTGAGFVVFQGSQAGDSYYTAAPVSDLDVIIARAPLNVIAGNLSRVFDQPNPAFTYGLSGFVNGDPSSVVTGSPTFTTTATPISPVASSPFPISIAQGSLTAANYAFIFSPGTLTVTAAPQYITFYAMPPLKQGSAPFPLTARASSGLAVTYSVTGPATLNNSMLTVTGPGEVTVTATQSGNLNFNAATPVSRSFLAQ